MDKDNNESIIAQYEREVQKVEKRLKEVKSRKTADGSYESGKEAHILEDMLYDLKFAIVSMQPADKNKKRYVPYEKENVRKYK